MRWGIAIGPGKFLYITDELMGREGGRGRAVKALGEVIIGFHCFFAEGASSRS